MEITYTAFFYKESENMYSVVFPDIEFGVTQGDTLDDAVFMAKDLLQTYFEGYKVADLPVAMPLEQAISQQKQEKLDDDYGSELLCVMPITAHIQERCKRLNITLPERTILAVDEIAPNRSAFIDQALREKLGL